MVRLNVAGNIATSTEALAALAVEKRWEVQHAVTMNPAVPGKILAELAQLDGVVGAIARELGRRRKKHAALKKAL